MSGDSFADLISELETMAKAMPAADKGADKSDEEKVAAAAEASGVDVDAEKKELAAAAEPADKGDDDAEVTKSFTVTLADGTEAEAVDGTEMIKSLVGRIEAIEGGMRSAVSVIKSRDAMIKSLEGQIATLSAAGRGRRTVLNIAEKPAATGVDMVKAEEGLSFPDFMVKALAAQAAGKIDSLAVSRLEAYASRGLELPTDIVRKVLA